MESLPQFSLVGTEEDSIVTRSVVSIGRLEHGAIGVLVPGRV